MITFEVCVDSGELAVREALGLVLANLETLSLDVEELATVELVLAEALNNVVEHAYPVTKPGNSIKIHCSQKVTGLHFAITDQGYSMPNGQTPLGLPQNVEVDPFDMPEGGFGWFLIKDLAKDVTYRRVENTNQLALRIAVAIH